MKLKDGFITHELNGKQVLVSVGGSDFSGLARSNDTAAFVIDCLKEDTTPHDIADRMEAIYDAPRERIEDAIGYVLSKLREVGALQE